MRDGGLRKGWGWLEVLWRKGKKRKGLLSISDSGELCMSPECVVLPDMSDSDGHGGPGIPRLPLLPIPPARPFYPRDKMRRRRVSSSATVLLSLIHSLVLCLLSQPFCSSFMYLSSHFYTLFPSPLSLFPHRSCLFAYWFALCRLSSVSSPPLPVLPFIRCSFFSPWNGSSEVAGTKIEQVVNTCLVSQIMDHLFDKPPFVCIKDTVLGHASERQRTPCKALLSPFLFTVYTLDFSINSGSWQL